MRRLTRLPGALPMAFAAALLAGCTTVGPDFRTPIPPAADGYTRAPMPGVTASAPGTLGAAQRFVATRKVAPEWWRAFGSAKIDTLVERALRHSPTLAAAEATLRQAQQTYEAQAGSTLYPAIDARLGASRIGSNAAGQGRGGNLQSTYNLYNAGVAVSYNFDLFGGNRRALEALDAQAAYQRFRLAGARLTLAGNVVTTAFGQAQAAAQLEATQAILEAQRAQLEIARRRFALGAASRTDVLTLRTQAEQTRASLPALRNRVDLANHLLAVLLGEAPGAVDIPRFALTDFTLPARLPVIVPSELVRQRPDIQASMALLQAATAQYGVAVASLYPQINLSASIGALALTSAALFGPGSMIWTLAGQLAQPLFNAGLRPAANAAEAGLQAAGANYRQTVLQALRDVADTLRQLDNDAHTLEAQAAADASARESLELVTAQYRLGASSYLLLLIAQQQAQQTRIALIAAQAARLADSAALYQAMGGGELALDSRLAADSTVPPSEGVAR